MAMTPVSDLRDQLRRAGFRITAEDARTLAAELERERQPPPRPAVDLSAVGDATLLADAEWAEHVAALEEGRPARIAQCVRVYVAERALLEPLIALHREGAE